MVNDQRRAMIILEGPGSLLHTSNMRREALQGALLRMSLVLGIATMRARTVQDTARIIHMAAKQTIFFQQTSLAPKRKQRSPKERAQLAMLKSIPGLGLKRAKVLLAQYETIDKLSAASPDELCEIEGIGLSTAQAVYDLLHEPEVRWGLEAWQAQS
jgi:ERCC4-type nuclease